MSRYYPEETYSLDEIEDEIPVTWDLIGKDRLVKGDPLADSNVIEVEDSDGEDPPAVTVKPPQPVLVVSSGRKRKGPPPSKRTAETSKRTKDAHDNKGHSSSLKYSQYSVVPPSSALSSVVYKNGKAFWKDMDKIISSTIDEALCLLNLDPRRYHPYYLRIYKYITIGQQQGYIQTPEKIMTIWEKYDKICECSSSKSRRGKGYVFTGDVSPYATFLMTGQVILNGKEVKPTRNEIEIRQKIHELEKVAKNIVKIRNTRLKTSRNPKEQTQIINDLQTRLEFFEHCKTVTFPSECRAMNRIWDSFLNEFENHSSKSTEAAMEEDFENTISPAIPEQKVLPEIIEIDDSDQDCKPEVDKSIAESHEDSDKVKLKVKRRKGKRVENTLESVVCGDTKRNNSKHLSPKKFASAASMESSSKENDFRDENEMDSSWSPPTSPFLEHFDENATEDEPKKITKSALQSSILKCSKIPSKSVLTKNRKTKARFLCKLKKKAIEQGKKRGGTQKTAICLERMICSGKVGKSKFKSKLRQHTSSKPHTTPQPKTETPQIPESTSNLPPQNQTQNTQMLTLMPDTVEDHYLESPPPQPVPSSPNDPVVNPQGKKKQGPKKKKKPCKTVDKQPQMCDECGLIFYNCNAVRKHKQEAHGCNLPEDNVETCPICQAKIAMLWPYTLWLHFHREHTVTGESFRDENLNEPGPQKKKLRIVNDPDGVFNCEFCSKLFPQLCNLRRHIDQIHGDGSRPFQCSHCEKMFKSKDTMTMHIKQVHLGEMFVCDICASKHQGPGKLWKHKMDYHGLTDLEPPPGLTLQQCEVCGEKLLRGLHQHMEKKHPNHEYVPKDSLEQDVRKSGTTVSSVKKRIKSLSLSYLELNKIRKREQRKKLKETGEGPEWMRLKYPCPVEGCTRIFPGKQDLERHIFQHYNFIRPLIKLQAITPKISENDEKDEGRRALKRRWTCAVCEQELKGHYEVIIHFLVKHPQLVEKERLIPQADQLKLIEDSQVNCFRCEEKLTSRKELRTHIKQMHSEFCCQCPECEEILTGSEDLQDHFFMEHRTLTVMVEAQNKTKTESINRTNIVKRKLGLKISRPKPKPEAVFQCHVCLKKFFKKNHLVDHFTEQHPDKLRVCPDCGLARLTERGLHNHRLEFHKLRAAELSPKERQLLFYTAKVNCELCQRDNFLRYFEDHLKTVHKIREPKNIPMKKCPCPTEFGRRASWIIHMEQFHNGKLQDLLVGIDKIYCSESERKREQNRSYRQMSKVTPKNTRRNTRSPTKRKRERKPKIREMSSSPEHFITATSTSEDDPHRRTLRTRRKTVKAMEADEDFLSE